MGGQSSVEVGASWLLTLAANLLLEAIGVVLW